MITYFLLGRGNCTGNGDILRPWHGISEIGATHDRDLFYFLEEAIPL